MDETVFTKIIKGEIPSYKVYEDEKTFAFLDIHPKTPGHVLVVPKNPAPYIWNLPDEDYTALMATVKKVGNKIKETLNPKWVGLHVEGMAVPHSHVHVFPFNSIEEFHSQPDMSADPNDEILAEMADKLRF